MKRMIGCLALAALLAGCASRVSRIEGALVQAGVSAGMAACLAPRLADRLTGDQLRTLAQAAKRAPGATGKIGPSEIVARVAGVGDPEIMRVVSAAGLHCVLKG